MERAAEDDVAAVVALKTGPHAKSRLADYPDPLRRRLAWTMAVDTLAALQAAVDQVVVVSNQPSVEARLRQHGLAPVVLPESGSGLNAALTHGARWLRAAGYQRIMACVGDLPALRPDSVRAVWRLSADHPRAYLADASGVGTTLLMTRTGELDPRFQGRSAAAHHASGARPLSPEAPLADARRDVDTEVDLAEAIRLGVGPATAALVVRGTTRLGRYAVVTTTAYTDGNDALAVTGTGYRVRLPNSAWPPGSLRLHPGQRLHAVLTQDQVLATWW